MNEQPPHQLEEQPITEQYPQVYKEYGRTDIDASVMRFRNDPEELINQICDWVRGGYTIKDGIRISNVKHRMMNEEGVSRLNFYIRLGMSKVAQMTYFRHESDIKKQLRPIARKWLKEMTKNMKGWGPTFDVYIKEEDYGESDRKVQEHFGHEFLRVKSTKKVGGYIHLVVKTKIRTKELIQQMLENTALQAMNKSEGGTEQRITAPNIQESYMQGQPVQQKKSFWNWGGQNG